MTARKLLVNLRHVKNECAFIRGFSRFILIKVLLLIIIIIGIGLKRDGWPSIFTGKICANILGVITKSIGLSTGEGMLF